MTTIKALPPGCITHILNDCSCKTLHSCLLVSHEWNQTITPAIEHLPLTPKYCPPWLCKKAPEELLHKYQQLLPPHILSKQRLLLPSTLPKERYELVHKIIPQLFQNVLLDGQVQEAFPDWMISYIKEDTLELSVLQGIWTLKPPIPASLRRFSLSPEVDATQIFIDSNVCLPKLEVLHIHLNVFPRETKYHLQTSFPNLKELKLFYDTHEICALDHIQFPNELKKLDLLRVMTTEQTLSQILSTCQNLEELSFNISGPSIDTLKPSPFLRKVTIHGSGLTLSFSSVLKFLEKAPKITTLSLQGNINVDIVNFSRYSPSKTITEANLMFYSLNPANNFLSSFFKNNKELQDLTIYLQSSAELPWPAELKVLRIYGDCTIATLSSILQRCKKLQELDLRTPIIQIEQLLQTCDFPDTLTHIGIGAHKGSQAEEDTIIATVRAKVPNATVWMN